MEAKKIVQNYFNTYSDDCSVEDAIDFHGFSIVKCKWWNQCGPYEYFEFIVKGGRIYNTNFDDVISMAEKGDV